MSIFSRKSKSEKGAGNREKKDKVAKKSNGKPNPEGKPAQLQSRKVPDQPTVDSAGKAADAVRPPGVGCQQHGYGGGEATGTVIKDAPQTALVASNATNDVSIRSPNHGHQMRRQSVSRTHSAEVYVTDPDAPPLPPGLSNYHSKPSTPRAMPRNNNGYFAPSSNQPQPGEGPAYGNPKMAFAARERGYIPACYSADSGYGSSGHSRAPSEQGPLVEGFGPQLSASNSELFPQLSLSEELAREPAFSEASFQDDESSEPLSMRVPDGVLKSSKNGSSATDPTQAARFLQPSRSQKKQTRFEDAPIAISTPDIQVPSSGPALDDGRLESATLPQQQQRQSDIDRQRSSYDVPRNAEKRPSFSAQQDCSTSASQKSVAPHRQNAAPARNEIPLSAAEREQDQASAPFRYAAPNSPPSFAPLGRVNSSQSITKLLPVRILDGFKVNKRGHILDEEGQMIGELFEGDIIDCVRQRVNGVGEVLDDYGTVVGRVRTVQRTVETPIARLTSPQLSPQLPDQQAQYQPLQLTHLTSNARRPDNTRRTSRSEAFTPAWQQQGHIGHSMFAEELRNYLASGPREDIKRPIEPLNFPGNVTAVELDARTTGQEEEALPVLDHSDIFMPMPAVPMRSARHGTPSPPVANGHARSASQQVHKSQTSISNSNLPDVLKQSKHTSAPPAPSAPRQFTPPPATPAVQPAQQTQEAQVFPVLSNPGDSIKSELQQVPLASNEGNEHGPSKSYVRPNMSPVPEDSHTSPKVSEAPASIFSYKGEIPAQDGPANGKLAAPRANGGLPPPSAFQRQLSSGSVNSAQYSSAGPFGPAGKPPRQFSTGVPGLKPTFQTRNSYNVPLKKSPLSSHETTPPDSDNGSWDGEAYALGTHRNPSLRSTTTTTTTMNTARPRTYFTHSGRVPTESSLTPAKEAAVAAAVNTAETASIAASAGKKKSRFGFGLKK